MATPARPSRGFTDRMAPSITIQATFIIPGRYFHPHRLNYYHYNRLAVSPQALAERRHLLAIAAALAAIPMNQTYDSRHARIPEGHLITSAAPAIRPDSPHVQKLSQDITMALSQRSHAIFNNHRLALDLMEDLRNLILISPPPKSALP